MTGRKEATMDEGRDERTAPAAGAQDASAHAEVKAAATAAVGPAVEGAEAPSVGGRHVHDVALRRPRARRAVVAAVLVVGCIGIVAGTGTGALSSFGWEQIASICPLGGLEAMLAAKTFLPRAIVFLLIALLASALLGKVFCSWVCPVPSVRGFLRSLARKAPVVRTSAGEDGERASVHVARPLSRSERRALAKGGCAGEKGAACTACAAPRERTPIDGRHLVLLGSLGSAAIFGFPVFCLVCPIGLLFATLVALVQLFGLQTLSWGLLVFPLVLVLELTVLKSWCGRFCPLGALMSLLSAPNRFFRPKVDSSACLRAHGVDCRVCVEACPEGLDPHSAHGMRECSKCGDCAANCPASAISFPPRRG